MRRAKLYYLRSLRGKAARIDERREDRPKAVASDSRCYERIFEHLSRRLPACRDCGCRIFAGQRDAWAV